MSIVSGHGGSLFFYADEDDEAGGTVNLDTWEGRWSCEYTAATPTGSGNGTTYLPGIAVNTWSATFPLDTTQLPETVGLYPGAPIYEAYFQRGNETNTGNPVYDLLERTTVTNVQMVDDNKGDAFRVMVSGMGGILTQGYHA